jgi:ABC-type multidrug transport system fused ATPase/permease subunit
MTVTVLGMYFWQISASGQAVLIGNIYLLMRYLDRISDLFFKFTSKYGDILKQRSRIANSELLSDEFKERSLTNHVLPENWKVLSIRDLTFSYSEDKDREANIKNASIEIERGQKIAFVGKRGSGKTTTLKIMRDLYQPQILNLSVDGEIIPHGFDGISQAITLIPQTPEIFASTIGDNITFGEDIDYKLIEKYTDIACFTEVVDRLPKGLESTTKEKGVNLSGGQQQGLALARGLLACRGRDIILLDEPTSSLDKSTEQHVYRNIFDAFPDRTIISTVHGLHLLPLFDITYVFDEGRIVGKGTTTELLQTCPQFQKLWRAMEKV